MFRINLKVALRNLWKNSWYTCLNILGLAIGFASFIIIALYVNFEYGYDKWDPSLKNVHQIGTHVVDHGNVIDQAELSGYFSEILKTDFKEVEKVGRAQKGVETRLSIDQHSWVFQKWLMVDSSFMSVYPLTMVYGDINEAISTPNSIAISLKKSREIFGSQNPINKVLEVDVPNNRVQYVIKAVWDDEKNQSYYGADILSGLAVNNYGPGWQDRPYVTLVRLRPGTDLKAFDLKMNETFLKFSASRLTGSAPDNKMDVQQAKQVLLSKAGISEQQVIAEPLNKLNIYSFFDPSPKRTTIMVITVLAIVIVLVSCVNFTNLSIAQASGRAREIGVRKVLGAQRSKLFVQFLTEMSLQCVVAFILSLFMAELLLPAANAMLETELIFSSNPELPKILLQLLMLLCGTILLSGFYPALVLSGMMPSKILKGNFSTGHQHLALRKVLLIFQFSLAGVLLISFLVINRQLDFMKNRDIGMHADQLIVIAVKDFGNKQMTEEQFTPLAQRLARIDNVIGVTRSTNNPIGTPLFTEAYTYMGRQFKINTVYTDLNYFKVLGSTIVQGRDFSNAFRASDQSQSIIFNESAFKLLQANVLDKPIQKVNDAGGVTPYQVVGVVKDIQTEGFEKSIVPTVYLNSGDMRWKTRVIISVKPQHISATALAIENTWKEIEPGFELSYHFASDKFNQLNHNYDRLNRSVFVFSAVSFFICLLGLFSLAAFNIRGRYKEIALRMVFGASRKDVIAMLNLYFLKLVVFAMIISNIFAFLLMSKWFNNFVYRIDFPITPFVVVNLCFCVLSVGIVSLLGYYGTKADPTKALRHA